MILNYIRHLKYPVTGLNSFRWSVALPGPEGFFVGGGVLYLSHE